METFLYVALGIPLIIIMWAIAVGVVIATVQMLKRL